MIQKPLKERLKTIAEKYNLDPKKVEEIEPIIWKWVKHEMSKGIKNDEDSFENIYLRYLGTFHASKAMIKHMKEHEK